MEHIDKDVNRTIKFAVMCLQTRLTLAAEYVLGLRAWTLSTRTLQDLVLVCMLETGELYMQAKIASSMHE